MADTKISALTAASALGGTEEFPANQGGNSRKVTAAQNQAFSRSAQLALAPPGAIAETFPRLGSTLNALSSANFISGRLHCTAIWLPKDTVITSITYFTGGTGYTTPTNQWFTLLSSSRVHLRSTVNDTNTAWAATTAKTLALSSTFTTTYSGLHYLGIMVTATTMAAHVGVLAVGAGQDLLGLAPVVNGTSNTGLTTPVADGTTANALNASVVCPYAYCS